MSSENQKSYPWWKPVVGEREWTEVRKVLESQYLNEGTVADEFESRAAAMVGAKFGVATTSGTAALFLSLKALEIGVGDEVLVPDITFIATANAVSLTGAKPVLVDVSTDTLSISLEDAERKVTSRTRGVIPVHVSGRGAPMEALVAWASRRKISVVEDAAEAFLSKHDGRFLGTWGQLGCFSFSPNKTVTTGQGGLVVTNDAGLVSRLRALKDQGRPKRGTGGDDEHPYLGFNFKLTNLQAAVGLAQLNYVSERVQRLKRHFEVYSEELDGCSGVTLLPFDIPGGESPLWVDALCESRDAMDKYLRSHRMDCRRFWFPLHRQAPYKQSDAGFEGTVEVAPKAIWLPSSYTLTDQDIRDVAGKIRSFYEKGAVAA